MQALRIGPVIASQQRSEYELGLIRGYGKRAFLARQSLNRAHVDRNCSQEFNFCCSHSVEWRNKNQTLGAKPMNTKSTWIMALTLLAGTAYGQVPAGNDTSDGNGNTGVGSLALHGPAASASAKFNTALGYETLLTNTTGTYNTASGVAALVENTTGSYNTATGALALYHNTTGSFNTASGYNALFSNKTGCCNTASGFNALEANTTGVGNTATGDAALGANTTGNDNTALGIGALNLNQTGSDDTATGASALQSNTTGGNNTASGYAALANNTTGSFNTASGANALLANTTGTYNTATGVDALGTNTTGDYNSAYGGNALGANTTGGANSAFGTASLALNNGAQNSAFGINALTNNTTGSYNTASGAAALFNSTTGSNNIAVGYQGGYKLTTGSDNIDIGNEGKASDAGIIRIGTAGAQTVTYIAGIVDSKLTGSEVVITASGQLGVKASSERYKTDIAPMGSVSEKLRQLRPVSFHLKANPQGDVQYGLIAEEVAKVYPELVIRDQNGRIDGVRYDELAPMLLNEVQKQQAKLAEVDELKQQIAELRQQNEAMQAALLKLQGKDRLVAQR